MTSRKSNQTGLAIIAFLVASAGGLASCSDSDTGPSKTYYQVSVVDVEVVRTVDGATVATDIPIAISGLEVEP